ncbi:hypothetical protein HaLaN_27637, partial [Haematococcus lacustris]
MPAGWNRAPAPSTSKPLQTSTAAAAWTAALRQALVAALCVSLAYAISGVPFIPYTWRLLTSSVLYGAAILTGIRAVNTAYRWHADRGARMSQAKLASSQRKLLGLPPVAP